MVNSYGQFTPASSDTHISKFQPKRHLLKPDVAPWGHFSYGSLEPSLMIPPIHTTGGHSPTIFVSSVQSWSFLLLILDNVSMAAGDGLS